MRTEAERNTPREPVSPRQYATLDRENLSYEMHIEDAPKARNREQWLNDAAELILQEILLVTQSQYPSPPYRIAVAPCSSQKRLGECFPRSRSEDSKNEIIISAHENDSLTILGVLVHELIHALDDCQSGHRNFFAKTARAVGLEGKFTATHAGDSLNTTLKEYIDVLGPIPHGKLSRQARGKGRNNNKIQCSSCGFQANLSRKWANAVQGNVNGGSHVECPVCFSGIVEVIFA